jgi:hypothetical protein
MQNQFHIPPPKVAKNTCNLLEMLAMRCAQLTRPLISQHEPEENAKDATPITTYRGALIDCKLEFTRSSQPGVLLHVPIGQSVLPWFCDALAGSKDALDVGRSITHIAMWNMMVFPAAPDAILQFVAAELGALKGNCAVLLEMLPASSARATSIVQLIDTHFESRIPIFTLQDKNLNLHFRGENYLTCPPDLLEYPWAIARCFDSFLKLVEAVKPVAPGEADELLVIFRETFSYCDL